MSIIYWMYEHAEKPPTSICDRVPTRHASNWSNGVSLQVVVCKQIHKDHNSFVQCKAVGCNSTSTCMICLMFCQTSSTHSCIRSCDSDLYKLPDLRNMSHHMAGHLSQELKPQCFLLCCRSACGHMLHPLLLDDRC